MNYQDVDWGYLRGALLAMGVVLAIGGTLLVLSSDFAGAREGAYRRERAKLMSVRNRYQTLDEEERLIEEYLPRYRVLEARGLIGREQRLDWIEKLREAARDVSLPELRYAIEAQRVYDDAQGLPTGSFNVYASRMRLELGLLHEGDLLDLFDNVGRRATGLFTVSSCDLRREAPDLDMGGTGANLRARCELDWLTVRQPVEGEAPS